MEYRHLGASGLQVSALSFGSWVTFGQQVDEKTAEDCLVAAHEAGVNFFDNAEVYAQGRSETVMGQIIRRAGWRRSDLVLSTKIFWGGPGPNDRGLSRKHLLEGTAAALARLQVDYVDLLFCHRPDPRTPVEETVRAMSHLVDSGRALYWGTSEWSAEQIRAAHGVARREHLVPPTMEQAQYNLFHRERVEVEYLPLYADPGLGLTTWSPLASGLLTGKYNDGLPAEATRATLPGYEWLREKLVGAEATEKIPQVRALRGLAAELECTVAQLALAWCARNRHVTTVITGATRPEQVTENLKSLDLVPRLTPTVMERIEAIVGNRPETPPDWREW